MRRPRWSGRAMVVSLLMLLAVGQGSVSAETSFAEPVPGQHVYDEAGALSGEEVADLERRAEGVAEAGSPIVVYLRAVHPDETDTPADAAALMQEWDVQSAPDARDGVVFFFNLEPDDLSRGEAGLIAGEQLDLDGTVPEYELERIYDEEMSPLLRDGELAAGIAAGLDGVERSLTVGPQPPPEPGAVQNVAAWLARFPMNILAVGGSLALAWYLIPRWQSRPRRQGSGSRFTVATTELPAALPPALAGALVTDKVDAAQAMATMLDLARRGKIVFELEGTPKDPRVSIRLLESPAEGIAHEHAVWSQLVRISDDDGVITHDRLDKLQSGWGTFQQKAREELVQRGWFVPDVERKRRPFFTGGIACLFGALVAFFISVIGEEMWGLIGVGVLLVTGVGALLLGSSYPAKTAEGQAAAEPWLGYRDGLRAAVKRSAATIDLDEAFPFAVAMGVANALADRLKAAGDDGYVPPGFRLHQDLNAADGFSGIYPFWLVIIAASGSSSTAAGMPSTAGTGAASGASTAGGRF